MAVTFTRTGAQIEEIHNTVDDPKSNAQFSNDIRTIAGEYRGLWPDTGGSANKGDTYQTQVSGTPTGQYFTALQNTTVDPVSDDVNWREVFSIATLPNYTCIVYKASGGNSAVDNMILNADVNQTSCTGDTEWLRIGNANGDIKDYQCLSDKANLNDFGIELLSSSEFASTLNQIMTDLKSIGVRVGVFSGSYDHTDPIVIPSAFFLEGINKSSFLTKTTNNTSGLPKLTGSYGGDLVMDVDASIILDHGYGAGFDNIELRTFAPVSVEHAIYHGFTRETSIGKRNVRLGELDTSDNGKRQFVNGITAQQGFFHDYGKITMFCKDTTWNYELNQAGTGCNVITCVQAWSYLATDVAIKFEGCTSVSLGQQYLEDTKVGVFRFFGSTGVTFDVLSIDRHECSAARSALYNRHSQITIGALTVNGITVAAANVANFIELSSGGSSIYSSLTINGVTSQTGDRNIVGLTTILKGRDFCAIRGVPMPPIGEFGNIGCAPNSLWSALEDTGKATTDQDRSILNSYESQAKNIRSMVAESFRCIADKDYSTVIGSTFVRPQNNYETCGGFGGSSGIFDTDTLSSNRKWSLEGLTGNIYGEGTVAGGHTFADFAEYFENAELGVIPLGVLVELEGDKVKPANGDEFIGVVSGTAGFILNEAKIGWQGRYLIGEFGEPIWEDVDDSEGNVVTVRKGNPDYSPEKESLGFDDEGNEILGEVIYSSRSERPREWSCVGLTGQVYVSVDESVCVGDYLTAVDGVGFKSEVKTQCRVMKKTSESIAKCLIK
ncbi:coil containing protein [Vibrio phage 1.144.O._10N.286.45.B3]|nr:coil containing protein [Vibrio phage 1.144.O._10N.286.45.B3]